MSSEIDRINRKIDKLINRIDMELISDGFDAKNVANIGFDFIALFNEKLEALQTEEDKKERGF